MSAAIDVLLVEDDPRDILLAEAVFRALQMLPRCAVAKDGEDAMNFLCSQGRWFGRMPGLPSLVLLDLKMPRINGFDFLKQVRADDHLHLVPVVALTSSREECDVERAYDLGVNGYVVKAVNFQDYRTTLYALARYWLGVNEPPPHATTGFQ